MIFVALALVAAPPSPPPGIIGAVGLKKCSELKAEDVGVIGNYVLGFWSGMNVAANTPAVGHSTNARGIVVEVIKACDAAPNLPLSLATLGVHMRFEREHR
jgi:hypothetical protein